MIPIWQKKKSRLMRPGTYPRPLDKEVVRFSIWKNRDTTLLTKVHLVKAMVFPVVWTWELDHKESWTLKNWCFWTVVLEKTLESPLVLEKAPESPLDSKEIKPANPRGNQPWRFTERTDAEAEATVLCSPDAKSQLTRKDSDTGKEWGQEERLATEGEVVGWHH